MDKSRFSIDKYKKDTIRAIDARFEAQKIAFSPLTFQAVRALLDLGILDCISDSGENGIAVSALCKKTGISEYGIKVLTDMALGMNIIKLAPESNIDDVDMVFTLGKVGFFLLNDELTRRNFNFSNDICYKGAYYLKDAIKSGKPDGLCEFGTQWTTIYEALASLPEKAKKSWFDFDHFYSDIAFPEALPIVFVNKPKKLIDIGGNTAKWAIACCEYDADVEVTIVDLPGQTAVAQKNAEQAGFAERINTFSGNILSSTTVLPKSADAVWMSQFLDCFSLHQVTKILKKVYEAVTDTSDVYVLEPLWDKQQFEGNAYSVMATSLYFTCMANGNSKMYRYGELVRAIEDAGFYLKTSHHNLGSQAYTLLVFRKKSS